MTLPDSRRERIAADPLCATLGIDLLALDEGRATTELAVEDRHLNFHGSAHGGVVYSLADAAFAAASNSHPETAVALETNVSYLEAVESGDTLRATATETHLRGRTAEYEVVVRRVGGSGDSGSDCDAGEADGEGDTGEDGTGNRVATFRGRVYRFDDE